MFIGRHSLQFGIAIYGLSSKLEYDICMIHPNYVWHFMIVITNRTVNFIEIFTRNHHGRFHL